MIPPPGNRSPMSPPIPCKQELVPRADAWREELRAHLHSLAEQHQLRQLQPLEQTGPVIRWEGRELVNLGSNDYLGLTQHPHLRAAAQAAVREFGTGSGSSRLVGGHLQLHARVEARFAQFKHAEAALICPTGYMANLAVLTSLAGPGDLVCLDKLCHASLIDATRASGAQVRVFPHLGYGKLARLLAAGPRAEGHGPSRDGHSPDRSHPKPETRNPRRIIVTDTIFSMDGDAADLPALCELADRYDAILVVDEAHGTGVLGATGAGLCELQGVAERVDVVVSTASKALGGLGGIITAGGEVIATIVNQARAFIYTTSVPPAQVAVLDAALDILCEEPERRMRLREMSAYLRQEIKLPALPADTGGPDAKPDIPSPIIPIITGTSAAALALAAYLRVQGFYAPAIRPPTVPPGAARVRLSLRADLEDRQIERLIPILRQADSTQ